MNIGRLPQQPIVQLKSQIKPEEVNEETKQGEITNTKEASDETVKEAPVNAASFLGQESYCAQMGIRFVSKKSSITPHETTKSNTGADLQNTADKKDNNPDITEDSSDNNETIFYGGRAKGLITLGKKLAKKAAEKWDNFCNWFKEQCKVYAAQEAIDEGVNDIRDARDGK